MDSRFIFLHPNICDVVTEKARRTLLLDSGQSEGPVRLANPSGNRESREGANGATQVVKHLCQFSRKAASLSIFGPYRERTHVVKESILR